MYIVVRFLMGEMEKPLYQYSHGLYTKLDLAAKLTKIKQGQKTKQSKNIKQDHREN